MDNIHRWRLLGKILFEQNKKTFIKKINGDLHFCKIKLISENYLIIKNFDPEQRRDKTEKIYWVQMVEFDEFREDGLL